MQSAGTTSSLGGPCDDSYVHVATPDGSDHEHPPRGRLPKFQREFGKKVSRQMEAALSQMQQQLDQLNMRFVGVEVALAHLSNTIGSKADRTEVQEALNHKVSPEEFQQLSSSIEAVHDALCQKNDQEEFQHLCDSFQALHSALCQKVDQEDLQQLSDSLQTVQQEVCQKVSQEDFQKLRDSIQAVHGAFEQKLIQQCSHQKVSEEALQLLGKDVQVIQGVLNQKVEQEDFLQLQHDVLVLLDEKVSHVDFQHLKGKVQRKVDATELHEAIGQKTIQGDFQLVTSNYNRCGPQPFAWNGTILSQQRYYWANGQRAELPFHLKTAWVVEHANLSLMYHIQFLIIIRFPMSSLTHDVRIVGYFDGKSNQDHNVFEETPIGSGNFLEHPQGGSKVKPYISSDGFLAFSVDARPFHPHSSIDLTVHFLGGCSSYLQAGKTTLKVTQAIHTETNL